ncbi:MAG: DUF6600 domain-containing protein [Myxococcales bacterium]|nr:hypothetical protein [Myxococcales bacterium]
MRSLGTILTLALTASFGCIVERPYEREPEPTVAAPPPPGPDTVPPDSSYQTQEPPPPAGSEIADEDVFYGGLSPYGTWTYVAPYGRVWIPAVGYGWRPYYYGRWVLTDWGWTFVSDDPWGWAAYHYGRWNFGIGVGWYWIPGRVWAPAWVSWRYGGGYAAWCPLGPDGVVFGYRHPAWVAVPERHFTQPIPRAAVPTQQTAPIVTTARPLGGPSARPMRTGSFGPPVAGIQRAVGQPVPRVAAANVIRPRATSSPAPMRTAGDPMRSPVQARPRAEAAPAPVGRPGAAPRPYTGAPRSSGPGAGARPSGPGPGARPSGPRGGGGMRYYAPPPPARAAPAAPPASRPAPHPHASDNKK